MIIDLPQRFRVTGKTSKDYAEVVDGVLHIYGMISFRKVMYSVTFTLKGKRECYYCGAKVKKKKITIDHMYPQNVGGPTIPNNLVPCCEQCNSQKTDMTEEQFFIYKSLDKTKQEAYRQLIIEKQEQVRLNKILEIPWIEYVNSNKFIARITTSQKFIGKKYEKQKAYFQKYGSLHKAIIIDKNGFILDGFITLMLAKENNITSVPAIILDNVVMHL